MHKRLRINLPFLLLMIPCIFLSGHSISIVSSSVVKVFMLGIIFLVCIWYRPKLRIPNHITSDMGFILCMLVGIVLSQLLYWKENMWLDPLMLFAKIILAYMITRRISFKRFAHMFSTLMAVLTIISITVLILTVYGIQVPCYTYISLNGFTYHTIGLCTWLEGSTSIMGPFWEQGLYATMAIYAIISEGCYTQENPRKSVLMILAVGILLSQSTAGYILMILAFYIIFVARKQHKHIWDVLIFILIGIGILFGDQIVNMLAEWIPSVFWKLTEQSTTGDTRLFSPVACFLIFCKNPFSGFGMSYATQQYNVLKPVFHIDALTSTSGFLLSAFGIWGISYTVFLCHGILHQKNMSRITQILFIMLFLIIVNKEPHHSIMMTYIMMFYLNHCQEDTETNEVSSLHSLFNEQQSDSV